MITSNFKISFIVNELAEEKSMPREHLVDAVIDGILAAYNKKYPHIELNAEYDKKNDELYIFAKKKVVLELYDDETEILLRKAKLIKENAEVGEELKISFEGKIGRIEIAKARQIIGYKIKSIEAESVYKEFSNKIGTIGNGTVHKVDTYGSLIMVYGVLGFLPFKNMIYGEKLSAGMVIKVLIQDVFLEPKSDSQILLDRVSTLFVKKLLELEIPEIFDGIVKIEKIVRIAGYKTKVLVSSRDGRIDPLGTCIGAGGSRIKPILKELGMEKIDIIPLVDSQEEQIVLALKPGIIENVFIRGSMAFVEVLIDNRSVVIGKGGKNISLASELVSITIELAENNKE